MHLQWEKQNIIYDKQKSEKQNYTDRKLSLFVSDMFTYFILKSVFIGLISFAIIQALFHLYK